MDFLPEFVPTTEDPQGPGVAGRVMYPSSAAYETHKWFNTTSMIFGGLAAGVGALAGSTKGPTWTVLGAAAGAAFGVYIGSQAPPA